MAKNDFFSLMYSPEKIEQIKSKIIQAKQQDALLPYEIVIDYTHSLGKHIELDFFSTYEQYLNPQTKTISFRIYHHSGDNSGYETYCLFLNPYEYKAQTTKQSPLNGFYTNETQEASTATPIKPTLMDEQALKEKWLKEQRYEQLESINASLNNQIKELEAVILNLQTEKLDIKKNRDLNLGGVAKLLVNELMTNQHIAKKFPQIETLSGILKNITGSEGEEVEDQIPNNLPTEEENITFKRKTKSTVTEQNNISNNNDDESENELDESEYELKINSLNEHDKTLVNFFHKACEELSEKDYTELIQLLQVLVEHPKAINFLSKQVNNYIRQIKSNPPNSPITN